MSLESWVVRLILKNTSLLLSVTLMLRCSDLGCSSALPPAPGDCSRSDIVDVVNYSNSGLRSKWRLGERLLDSSKDWRRFA